MTERIKGLIPILSIAIILTSLLKLTFFYSYFDVQIKYFIGLSELGILITDDLFVWLICSLSLVILVTLESLKTEPDKQGKIMHQGIEFLIIVILLSTIAVLVVNEIILVQQAFIALCISISVIIIFTILSWFSIFSKMIIASNNKWLVLFISSFISVVLIAVDVEVKTINSGKYTGTYIKTPTKEHTSSDSSFFIGKTERYVFIYNKKTKSTEIIPTDDIIAFNLKVNRRKKKAE